MEDRSPGPVPTPPELVKLLPLNRTSKLPSEKVVLLVLGSLLAAALIIIYRLSLDKIQTNRTVPTLKEENEALRKNLSEPRRTMWPTKCPPPLPPSSCKLPPEFPLPTSVRMKTSCLKCEAGWEQNQRKCYYFNSMRSSWVGSRCSYNNLGGNLVKKDSREEQMFLGRRVGGMIESNRDMFWIGLTDSEEGGTWLWVDGSPLDT
ncbi:hypothetical protein CHARACLAT_023120, partial [Characodon lateralis]|nr:hypothetical protein [Characodon lateralis]